MFSFIGIDYNRGRVEHLLNKLFMHHGCVMIAVYAGPATGSSCHLMSARLLQITDAAKFCNQAKQK